MFLEKLCSSSFSTSQTVRREMAELIESIVSKSRSFILNLVISANHIAFHKLFEIIMTADNQLTSSDDFYPNAAADTTDIIGASSGSLNELDESFCFIPNEGSE